MLVAGKMLEYGNKGCPPAVESQITCVPAEPAPFLNRVEGPEQRPEFVHVASPDIDAATTPTAGALPFFDFTPMSLARHAAYHQPRFGPRHNEPAKRVATGVPVRLTVVPR